MKKKIALIGISLLILTLLLTFPNITPTTTAQPPTPSPQGVYHWKIELAQKKCNAMIVGYLTFQGVKINGTEFELNCTQDFVFWKVSTTVIPTDIEFMKYIDWNKDGIWDVVELVTGTLTQPTSCHCWYQHKENQTLIVEPVVSPPPVIGSQWRDTLGRTYIVVGWDDSGWPLKQLSYCDQVVLEGVAPPQLPNEWHVNKNITTPTPQWVLDKLVVVEVHEQPYASTDPYFYWQLTMKTHGIMADLIGYLTKNGLILNTTFFNIHAGGTLTWMVDPDLQCQVKKTPYCTVPNDLHFEVTVSGMPSPITIDVPLIMQFPWTKTVIIGTGKNFTLELTEVQMYKYWVMGGETTSDGQLGINLPWFAKFPPTDPNAAPVPFATRKPDMTTWLNYQNITFTQKDPITGIVKLGVPAASYTGLDHVYWSPRLTFYFRVLITLDQQGCGWLFTGDGKEPILGAVDYRVFDNNTGVYTFGPDGQHSPTRDATWKDDVLVAGKSRNPLYGQVGQPEWHAAGSGLPLSVCLQGFRGPDDIPCTGDDILGQGDTNGPDGNGSSILYLPTKMTVTYWNGTAWALLFGPCPWPQLLTTGTAYDKVIEPASMINGCNATQTGWRWEFRAGVQGSAPYKGPVCWKHDKCNAFVKYVCVWSVIETGTTMGLLDVRFHVVEKKVREDCVIADVDCNQVVNILDILVASVCFGAEDEGFGKPAATRGAGGGLFDARADLAAPRGLINVLDILKMSVDFGKMITKQCILRP